MSLSLPNSQQFQQQQNAMSRFRPLAFNNNNRRRREDRNPTQKMSRRPEHRPMFLLFLVLFVSCTAAQPPPNLPLPPPPSQSVSVNFNPMVGMLITLTLSALFVVIFFSIYIIDCTSSQPEPAAHAGMAPVPKGLDGEVIMGFPTFVYSDVKEHKIGKGVLECVVCLCEFEDYEKLRLIPKCDHVFHQECIDEWLAGHVTCPVCRANLAPPSGDSVKDRTDGSRAEEHDHVEIDIDELAVESEEVMRGRDDEGGAEQSNGDLARESYTGKPPRRLGRSHSTGHSLVCPKDDTERFTLRLPEEVRKQIMERPMTPYFPSEGSSRRGIRSGDGSSRERFLRRLDRLDRPTKSERWVFSKMPALLTRVSSMVPPKSPKFANNDCRVNRAAKSTAGKDRSDKSGEPAAEHGRPPI